MSRRIVLIEYYFTATRLFAFGVRSDFEQPAVMEIAIDVTALQSEVREVSPQLEVRIGEVVHWPALLQCVAPILEWTAPGDLVCIVPSGPLFYIPLHAISVAGGPLMLRNPVFYAPSSSALRYCIRRRQTDGQVRTPTVFGNPEGDLISSGREAEAVAELLGVTALLRDDVTRENWRKAMASSDVIHYAGHAEFEQDDPLASGLRLAGGDVLRARDFFEFGGHPIRLITLSGCVTGYNNVHPGDELLGLTRSLIYAGASSLLVTLWEIDDVSASLLMREFYRGWLQGSRTKVDALCDAQRFVLEHHSDNPSHWAPYLLIGDWI